MSNINTGGPAFPAEYPANNLHMGLTVRDYFAAKAMQFSVASFEEIAGIAAKSGKDHRDGFLVAAKFAYQIADAMLKAREAS